MIDLKGYEEVSPALPGEFAKLPAGGYICKIINADITKSKADNTMLVLFVDIADGDFKDFFKAAVNRVKSFNSEIKWDNTAIYRQLIFANDGKVSSFFKGLITCFEKSNPTFKVNPHSFNEQSLRGLLIGFVFADEQYPKRDGSIGSRTFIKFPKTVSDIRDGNFKIPDTKKFEKSTEPSAEQNDIFDGSPVDDKNLPF